MDSRKILEIYKLINDRSIKLASSWPSVSDIPPGAIVLDSDGVIKECRWVGNFVNNNVTTLQDTILCNFGFNANADYELTLIFSSNPSNVVPYFGLFCCGGQGGVATTRGLWIERGNLAPYLIAAVFDSSGGIQRLSEGSSLIDNKFYALTIRKIGAAVHYVVDGVIKKTTQQTITVNTFASIVIGSQVSSRSIAGQIAKVNLVHSNQEESFCYDFTEGGGLTLYDRCGNGRNGEITDALPADFWKKALVPVSLLQ